MELFKSPEKSSKTGSHHQTMPTKTPQKLYTSSGRTVQSDSICCLCGENLKIAGKSGSFNIAESRKPAGDSTVELKKWVETLFSVVINEELLTVSSVVCRKCVEKTKKIKDTLNNFKKLKQKFVEVGNLTLSIDGISWQRVERLSKSPEKAAYEKILSGYWAKNWKDHFILNVEI